MLHGYHQPTALILHEEGGATWAGRLASKAHNMAITAVSLGEGGNGPPARIWTMDKLPSDCSSIVAVPKPVGGVVVVSSNALLYFNQVSTLSMCCVTT